MLFVPTICVITFILLKNIYVFKKDGYIYKVYHNNDLYEKNTLGNFKTFFVVFYMGFHIIRLYLSMDDFYIFMNPMGSGESCLYIGNKGDMGAVGGQNPFTAQVSNPGQSNTEQAISGKIIHKVGRDNKDYLIVEPSSGSDRYMLNQLKRGALSDCDVVNAPISRRNYMSMNALDLTNVYHTRVSRNNFLGVIIPNIFDDKDNVVSNYGREIEYIEVNKAFITGDKITPP